MKSVLNCAENLTFTSLCRRDDLNEAEASPSRVRVEEITIDVGTELSSNTKDAAPKVRMRYSGRVCVNVFMHGVSLAGL